MFVFDFVENYAKIKSTQAAKGWKRLGKSC